MLFNSLSYAVFLPVVWLCYWCCPPRARWGILLAASCWFYASWNINYLALIAFTALSSYGCALKIEGASPRKRKRWLWLALGVNLGLLFLFKYYSLATQTAEWLVDSLRGQLTLPTQDWLLPVGISFYTFQALGYVVDVYRGQLPAQRRPHQLALYVIYFPQLVAGPIERASRLLPQLSQRRPWKWSQQQSGVELILLGLFKKLVISDRLATYVNTVYNDPNVHSGFVVVFATYCFAFQILCDFSAYSDIATGSARLLGHDLMLNFRRPYAARSIQDFWRRWHISLSTWFRDYLYVPMGGNRNTTARWSVSIMAVFTLSGLWHGAAWSFVAWGALHGFYILFGRLLLPVRARLSRHLRLGSLGPLQRSMQRLVVFHLVCFAWVFFRANSFADAVTLISSVGLQGASWSALTQVALGSFELKVALFALVALEFVEWNFGSPTGSYHGVLKGQPVLLRSTVLCLLALSIPIFGEFTTTEFIYFQF